MTCLDLKKKDRLDVEDSTVPVQDDIKKLNFDTGLTATIEGAATDLRVKVDIDPDFIDSGCALPAFVVGRKIGLTFTRKAGFVLSKRCN